MSDIVLGGYHTTQEEKELMGTNCPRCGMYVLHDTNRPIELWSIPAYLPSGEHYIEDDAGERSVICKGMSSKTSSDSLLVRIVKWCLS